MESRFKKYLNLQIHLGTIHILRNHIFRIFGPPSSLRNRVFSTENNQKQAFSDPPPPLQVLYVIYEWSLMVDLYYELHEFLLYYYYVSMNQSLCIGERSYKMSSFLISQNVKNFSHKKQYPTEKIQVAIYHVIHKRVRNRDKNIWRCAMSHNLV